MNLSQNEGKNQNKIRILICGILPPPYFGHSMTYQELLKSDFIKSFDIKFLNLHFWSYDLHQRVTLGKLWKMAKYLAQYIYLILKHRPKYILYNMSFYKMPFLKDFVFCAVGKIFGCNIVIHDHGQYVKELYEGGNRFTKKLVKKFCAMASSSIVMGEGTKDCYKGLMDQSRLKVVPGSVSDFAHKFKDQDGYRKGQKTSDHVQILYFSYISRSKGIWTALQAIEEVIKKDPRARFTFAGPFESEELKNKIMDYVKNQQLEKYVQFLGYVDNEEKRTRLMRGADIFIFPTHRDVFGLVLLHAMAEGLPIIASIEGTIPEIIKGGENGFLIKKGDYEQLAQQILLLASDEPLRKTIGENNRQRYLKVYSSPEYGRKMINAFEEIDRKSQPSLACG